MPIDFESVFQPGVDGRVLNDPVPEGLKVSHVPRGVVLNLDVIKDAPLVVLERKFMTCSHCLELCQFADLASDWLFTLV